jgi:hypothetical protein
MDKHESPQSPANQSLPRPVVLRPEDLASVAAGAPNTITAVMGKIIIMGGFPVGPWGGGTLGGTLGTVLA